MKVCVAQTRPFKGDIQRNIASHLKLTRLALSCGATVIIFPELSITGYEPTLVKDLATDKEDARFDCFQEICDNNQVTIGLGVPIKDITGITISMIFFQPHKTRQLYSKKYLHPDEEPYFIGLQTPAVITVNKTVLAPAICYEISVPEHAANALQNGADIYIASVAKTAKGAEAAIKTLAGIAASYSIPVLLANCTGPSDNFESGGKTSAWNNKGLLLGQLDGIREGILLFDTITQETIEKAI